MISQPSKVWSRQSAVRQLSPAQRRILQLIGQGKMTKEIAEEMRLSEKGVNYHRGIINSRCRLHSVAEAVHTALTLDARPS
jgi:DNA-binding CsgD family transcriptional regulator